MSPSPIAATGRAPGLGALRCVAACAGLLCASVAAAQELSAIPETPRPIRRLDTDLPLTLADASRQPASFTADAAKTPIRRIADDARNDAASPRASWTVWLMLVVMVGAAAGLSLWTRRGGGGGHWKLPATVFQVLGKSAVGPNQSVTLLRLGERVLLVSSSGATLQTLAVVTDPVEVATITSECLSRRSAQISQLTRSSQPTNDSAVVAGTIGAHERRTPRATPGVNHA